jgi:hypothetical protein
MDNEKSRLWMELLYPAPLTEEEYCQRDDERMGEKIDELLAQQDDLKILGYERDWE